MSGKHDHDGHDHHDHAGHDHGTPAKPARQDHADHDHADHDHAGHDHGAHAHAGHDHAAHGTHDHAGHDHSGHDHDHAHGFGSHHHHHGDPATQGRAFAIAIALNSLFVAVEFIYGFLANSTALMADAGHNLSDVLGLVLAWSAAVLAKRAPSARYTYGLRSSSILAALGNALLLLLACGAIAWEALHRFTAPAPVEGMTVSVVAAIGVAINGFSAWLFMAGSKGDLNIRGA
jgi:cobalt-zinc-cadmium efflux system protein